MKMIKYLQLNANHSSFVETLSVLIRISLLIVFAIGLPACSATTDIVKLSGNFGYDLSVVKGKKFSHRIIFKAGKGRQLHVYIEGDGRAWLSSSLPASNPSPDRSLMFDLMMLDKYPALFLGRPCYFVTLESVCSAYWWTHGRYSEAVVDSMAAVLNRRSASYDSLVLIGHSGGGTIAMLLARRVSKLSLVVTLAGNLDVASWVAHHNYSPLLGSLDPMQQPLLAADIEQRHFLGANDSVILSDWTQAYVNRYKAKNHTRVGFTLLADLGHNKGWQKYWPDLLLGAD